MHYYIIVIIVIGIVTWQMSIFLNNQNKISLFRNIFPKNNSNFLLIHNSDTDEVVGIQSDHQNPVLEVITNSINNYLINNNGAASDFHLMKDIVDRNCDAQEEAIHSQVPFPLYLGLVGTMLGILIGVGFLVISGGLKDLLSTGNGNGAEGIETLLGGVALAMISSIMGILLSTFGSTLIKDAKSDLEKHKNEFLSWMQAELLPNISNDTSSALVKMTRNLSKFNDTFAINSQDLGITLSKVNDSYANQADLMKAISRLKIEDIASANIDVYDKLKKSTTEIGVFAKYLKNSNKYLEAIEGLNQKLDTYENRTQVIENAGNFFKKNEKWLAENFDSANLEVRAALERFNKSMIESLNKTQESFNGQILNFNGVMQRQQEEIEGALKITNEILAESFTKTQIHFEKAISEQQKMLLGKLQETTKLVEELKNLTHIKEGIKDFGVATNRQNLKIDELTNEIRNFSKIKMEGGIITQEISFPKWLKILIISGSGLVGITCLSYIVLVIIDLISKF